MQPVRLRLSGVTRRFADPKGGLPITAVQDVSFDVRAGEFLTVVGPSGCGKSTLLDLVAGFDRPDEGVIEENGIPVSGPGPDRVMVFQEHTLFPWLSVRRNVAFGLRHAANPPADLEARVDQALRLVQLQDFGDAAVYQLSGGMRQRAALARALVLEPEVLLMDEPFAALDVQTRDLMVEELRAIWARTRSTIVFVTHHVREAVYLGDRVVLLTFRPGRVKRIYEIDVPRPRDPGDPRLEVLVRTIVEDLHAEVEKAVRKEFGR
jgi:NitT/TauT family transport system ATP-binding protein